MLKILVPLDGSNAAEEALHHAILVAKTFPAELTLLRVIAESDAGVAARVDSIDLALWRYQAKAYLVALIAKHAEQAVPMQAQIAEGNPAKSILKAMRITEPDLLVMTRYGRGNAQDFIAGGTAQKVVSSASNCSVLLLDPKHQVSAEQNYQRILVPIDDGKNSDCALAVATMIAEISGASVLMLYVIEQSGLPMGMPDTRQGRQLMSEMYRLIKQEAQRRLRELTAKLPRHLNVDTQVRVSEDLPFTIESAAEDYDCDLLLLHVTDPDEGSRRHSSINQSLIQYSHRPLFILSPGAPDGLASNFRSVYLDDHRLQAV